MAKSRRQRSLFPELDTIVGALHAGVAQDLVILIIPSHDKTGQPLSDQKLWAQTAMEVFAQLFRGATAFETFKGVYKCDDGTVLWDEPILIESYVSRNDLDDRAKLIELLTFVKRMGSATNQAAVGLIINNVFHEITEFG